jgi:hypothetical protein
LMVRIEENKKMRGSFRPSLLSFEKIDLNEALIHIKPIIV